MEIVFLKIINMSLTATYVLIPILALRLLLKHMPKWISYVLWSVVFVRLVCPVSFSSAFSLFSSFDMAGMRNGRIEYIPSDIGFAKMLQVKVGMIGANQAINNTLPQATPMASINPMQMVLLIGSYIWIVGIIIMLIYSVVSYKQLKTRLSTATLIFDNVFETDEIASPFVCGLLKPKIYLPVGIKDPERKYVLHHERTHILRKDYIVKPFAFLVLSIHWFNPFVWLAFRLMSQDMEMSCDERVICELDHEGKVGYSETLTHLATKSPILTGSPLAFGERGTKDRVKNVLNYKKPRFWVGFVSIITLVAAAMFLLANPVRTLEVPNIASIKFMEIEQIKNQESSGNIKVLENKDMEKVLSTLSGAKKTLSQSIHDYPTQKDYIVVRLILEDEMRTLCLYMEGGNYYIEEPYIGIYKGSKKSNIEVYGVYEKNKEVALEISIEDEQNKLISETSTTMPGGLPKVYSDEKLNLPFINGKLLPNVYWETDNKTNIPKEGAAVSIPSGRLTFAFLPTTPHWEKSIFIDETTLKHIIDEVNTAEVLPNSYQVDWSKFNFHNYCLYLYVLTDGNVYNQIMLRGPITNKKDVVYVDISVYTHDDTYGFENWRVESPTLGRILKEIWGPRFDLQLLKDVTRIDMRVLDSEDNGNIAVLEGNNAKNIAERMLETSKIIIGYGKCPYSIELSFTFSDGSTQLGWLNGDSCPGIALENGPDIMFDKEITNELYKLLDYGEGFIQ